MNKKYYFEVAEGDSLTVADFLAEKTPVSKMKIKLAAQNGAVWIKHQKSKKKKVRKAKTPLKVGDEVSFFYDSVLNERKAPDLAPIFINKNCSVWDKPAGLVAQGSPFGDHLAMERIVSKNVDHNNTFLIHRLDREVSGLMVFAHTRGWAAELSKLWASSQIIKEYQLEVIGRMPLTEGDDCLLYTSPSPRDS